MKKTVKYAVCYYRVSTNKRFESIPFQKKEAHEFCKKNNIIIIAEYEDEGISGTSDNRKGFQQLFNDIESGKINPDILLVFDMSRFARNASDAYMYMDKLKKRDIELLCTERDYDGSCGDFIKSIDIIQAEKYSQDLSDRISKSMNVLQTKNKFQGGFAPYGYSVNINHDFEIVGHEAKNVELIFKMYKNGASYKEIIKALNDRNALTRLHKQFTPSSILDIIKNEIYIGTYVYNKSFKSKRDNKFHKNNEEDFKRLYDVLPAIIDKELFEQANKRRLHNQKGIKTRKDKRPYLLSNKIKCTCGGNFIGNVHGNIQNGKRYESISYTCGNRKNGCKCKSINANKIEDYVVLLLLNSILHQQNADDLYMAFLEFLDNQYDSDKNQIERLKKTEVQLDAKIQTILNHIENNDVVSDAMMQRYHEREQELKTVKEDLMELQNNKNILSKEDFKLILENAYEELKTKNYELVKPLITKYIDEIIVSENDLEIRLNINNGNIRKSMLNNNSTQQICAV